MKELLFSCLLRDLIQRERNRNWEKIKKKMEFYDGFMDLI